MTNPNGSWQPQAPTPTNPASYNTEMPGETQEWTAESTDSLFVSIDPLHPPDQKTLVYAPDVEIFIARDNKQYDVSRDIVSVAVQRNENAISTLVFKLANKIDPQTGKLRYNQVFERMDRVICRMKRVKWILVFSGYLDSVPHIQLYPGTVNFKASCTLKRILHTWWDPGLAPSSALMDQAGIQSAQEQAGDYSTDTGLGSLLRRFLVEVGGWHPSNILIQRFPETYYQFMQIQLQKSSKTSEMNEREFRRYLLGDDISLATWEHASTQPGVNEGSFTTGVTTQPERKMEVIKTVDAMGMGPDNIHINAATGIGDSAQRAGEHADDPTSTSPGEYQPAWKAEQEVGRNWEEAGKKSDAAIHCFMCIAVESTWQMYANNAVPESLNYPFDAMGSDGTSVGLYQQTEGNGWGSVRQRMNVRESTEMFLRKLNGLNWRNMDRGTAVQAVQQSAFPARYATFEQAAIDEVRQLRSNQTTGSGGSPTTGNANIPGVSPEIASVVANSPIPPGQVANVANKTATATASSSSPQAAAASTGARPRFDTQGAILFARSKTGLPYQWGGTGPAGYDCSGLVQAAYRSIGIEIPRVTNDQQRFGQSIPAAQAKPGDLIFPNNINHVVMVSDTPGMIIEAQQSGVPIHEVPISPEMANAPAVHIKGTTWGGPGAAEFNPFPTQIGNPQGTVNNGVDGSIGQTGSSEPIARNLFTYMFVTQPPNAISPMFGGEGEEEKAFMNDQSMFPTVVSMCQARLCKFTSAPNGDFQAYYPDYFGMDGKRAVLKLEDIEMKNVQIDLNDDALVTHAYVAGSQMPQNDAYGILGWIMSKGYATVENEWLFRKMTLAAPTIPGEKMRNGKAIMRQFGARPLVKSMPMIQAGPMEFLAAVQLFMECWAQQYATQIELTFMPELYVGNRIELVSANLQVYVAQVTHSCDWEAGFSTTAMIMAPSNSGLGRMVSQITSIVNQNNANDTDQALGAQKWLY